MFDALQQTAQFEAPTVYSNFHQETIVALLLDRNFYALFHELQLGQSPVFVQQHRDERVAQLLAENYRLQISAKIEKKIKSAQIFVDGQFT